MPEKWGSLYIIAAERLGDESEACEWVMRASSAGELERRLVRLGPLPPVLPQPGADIVAHVALLRRRAARRRRAVRVWGPGAIAALVGVIFLMQPWAISVPEAEQPFLQSELTLVSAVIGADTFQVHKAMAGSDGLTVSWSLTGPSAVKGASPILKVEAAMPALPGEARSTVRSPGRGKLSGQTWLPVVVPPAEGVPLRLQVGDKVWRATTPVDRTELLALERSLEVNQVISRRGAGVFIKSLTLGPTYTVVEWEPWMAPEATRHFSTKLELFLKADEAALPALPTSRPRSAHFGPVPGDTVGLLITSNELVWTGVTRLALKEGATDIELGVTVDSVTVTPEHLLVAIAVDGTFIPVETVMEDATGQMHRPARLQTRGEGSGGVERSTLLAAFPHPQEGEPGSLQIRLRRSLPPLELAVWP